MPFKPSLVAAVVVVAALLTPATAGAVTVSHSGAQLSITGGGEPSAVTITVTSDPSVIQINDSTGGGAVLSSGGACQQLETSSFIGDPTKYVECPRASVASVAASLGGGDDAYRDEVDGIADTVSGGSGNDALRGAIGKGDTSADTMRGDEGVDELWAGTGSGTVCDGGAGNDTLWCMDVPAGGATTLIGGSENDTIYGGDSNDAMDGGSGDDTLAGYLGADDLRGGTGHDTVAEARASGVRMHWSIDDVANDGLNGTEGDNVRTDVEHISGSSSNDIIVGSASSDVLEGNLGDDQIYGMGGSDKLDGGVGNDVVRAADGAVDEVYCGLGFDAAEIDGNDLVDTSCEEVKGSLPSTGAGAGGGGGAVAALSGSGSFRGPLATFRLTLPSAGTVTVIVRSAGARASVAKARVLGKLTKSVAPGANALKVRLKGRSARKLMRKKRFTVRTTTVFTPQGGQPQAAVTRKVTLRRKR